MCEAGFSLGSNLGDRLRHLRAAVRGLDALRPPGGVFLVSHLYETEPVDCPPDSPPFYNLAVVLETDWTPFEILESARRIERERGRAEHRDANAPRPLDIDLLYCGDQVIDTPELTLPHPRMHHRAFVLRPLAELRPDRVEKASGENAVRDDSGVVKVGAFAF